MQTEWAIQRDVTTECLRTSRVTQRTQKRYQAIAVANSRRVLATVTNNNVARDDRVCTRAGDAELRNRRNNIRFVRGGSDGDSTRISEACIDVHEAHPQFEGISEGIGGERGLSGTILRNRPGKSGQGSVQGKGTWRHLVSQRYR